MGRAFLSFFCYVGCFFHIVFKKKRWKARISSRWRKNGDFDICCTFFKRSVRALLGGGASLSFFFHVGCFFNVFKKRGGKEGFVRVFV